MRFFSKIVVICNVCFIIAFIMRLIENRPANTSHDAIIPLPVLEGSIVVLGFLIGFLLNAAFIFIVLFRKSIRKPVYLPGWIIIFNFLVFLFQLWAQFFRNY